jgi:hypothetical protein
MLRTRQLIPPLTLHTPGGRTLRAWDFKQKKNVVIAFLDASCARCEEFAQRLAAQAVDLHAREAAALLAYLEPPPEVISDSLPAGIFSGADMSGRAARAFLGEEALSAQGLERRGVFVADRYGELFAQWVFEGHQFPGIAEILSSLNQMEIACEECGVPEWPAEN